LEIAAFLEPAREVGGDLYDYFLVNNRHLFFMIGDVSDKGVPAALFMAVTKTLLKGLTERAWSRRRFSPKSTGNWPRRTTP
jgi:phosphoserine phosphatase RsbU/P